MPWPILAFEIIKDIVFPEIESFINRGKVLRHSDAVIKAEFENRWRAIMAKGQYFLDTTAPPTPPPGPQ